MTNEELLEDLKQFVQGTVSQATAGLASKDDLQVLKTELRTELASKEDLQTFKEELIAASNEQTTTILAQFDELSADVRQQAARLDDHDGRISSLEQAAA